MNDDKDIAIRFFFIVAGWGLGLSMGIEWGVRFHLSSLEASRWYTITSSLGFSALMIGMAMIKPNPPKRDKWLAIGMVTLLIARAIIYFMGWEKRLGL